MSFYLCPLFIASTQYTANTGLPLSGGFIYSFLAGTTTPAATATSNTGGANNSNPIVLDVTGRLTQEIWQPAGIPYKYVLTDSANVQIGPTYDNISGINDITGDIQTVNVINSVSSADTANAASANSARWAYSHATDAYNQANNALTTANAAASAANSSGVNVYDNGVFVFTSRGINFKSSESLSFTATANGSSLTDLSISANTAAQNVSANGYTTLPGGLILQWGVISASVGGEVSGQVGSFAHPFPSTCLFCSLIANGGTPMFVQSTTSTQFTYGTGYSGGGATSEIFYLAIGK